MRERYPVAAGLHPQACTTARGGGATPTISWLSRTGAEDEDRRRQGAGGFSPGIRSRSDGCHAGESPAVRTLKP